MIDLHLHTTASDGSSTPVQLVEEALSAGLTTIAVTDHDTMAAVGEVSDAAGSTLAVIPGIEITAVEDGLDVHVLGYFLDPESPELGAFLTGQRDDRRRRIVQMIERLAAIGAPIAAEPLLALADTAGDRALGRPLVARALVDAGHASDIADAFDRFLGAGQPAFVERFGRTAVDVVEIIARAGGVAALAHPGRTQRDDLIAPLAAAGLTAIEVFHPDHDAAAVERYRSLAVGLGLAMTGGSDYHGPGTRRAAWFGNVHLPADEFARFLDRVPAERRL